MPLQKWLELWFRRESLYNHKDYPDEMERYILAELGDRSIGPREQTEQIKYIVSSSGNEVQVRHGF